jgi:hypothetical protein
VVRKRLGSLEVLSDVAGAEVMVDGQGVGKLPLSAPLRLPAGTVVLQVQAPGYLPVQRSVMVQAEQLGRESFQLVRLQQAAPALPPTAAAPPVPAAAGAPLSLSAPNSPEAVASGTSRRGVLWGGLAATALGIGLTTWSGLDTLSARDKYVATPTEQGYHDGVGRERRTNILLISTCVVAATTVAWGVITNWGTK